jgi:hypothetical protein
MALGVIHTRITSLQRNVFENSMLQPCKNDVTPANGVITFSVVYNSISPEAESGLNLIAPLCAGLAMSVFSTPLLCIYIPAQNDFFQKPFSGLISGFL